MVLWVDCNEPKQLNSWYALDKQLKLFSLLHIFYVIVLYILCGVWNFFLCADLGRCGVSPFEYALGESGGSLQLAIMNAQMKWATLRMARNASFYLVLP